jgi:hypothetical protein
MTGFDFLRRATRGLRDLLGNAPRGDAPFSGMSVRIDPTWPYRYLWLNPLGEQLRFTYVDFGEGFSDSSQPTYADTDIPGRGELIKTFMGTSNKEISFSAQFRVQGQGTDAINQEVIWPARFLDALKHPVYDDGAGLSQGAPPVLLQIGRLFLVRAVVTSAEIRWVEPFEPTTLLPHGAEVSLTFQVVRRRDPDLGYRIESILNGRWR